MLSEYFKANIYQIKLFFLAFIITMIVSLFVLFSSTAISNSQVLLYGNNTIPSSANYSTKLNQTKTQPDLVENLKSVSSDLYYFLPQTLKLKYQIISIISKYFNLFI